MKKTTCALYTSLNKGALNINISKAYRFVIFHFENFLMLFLSHKKSMEWYTGQVNSLSQERQLLKTEIQ